LDCALASAHGCLFLWLLGSVLRATLVAIANTARVQCAANDVIANTRQVLHTTAANEHDRVLLQVVSFTRDVRSHFVAVRQAHARNFAQRRVRLLRRGSVDSRADTALLRIALQRRSLLLLFNL